MSLLGFDTLYSVMMIVWTMITIATLGLLWKYIQKINNAGALLFKKKFALSFGVGYALMCLFVLIKQIVSYTQTDNLYDLLLAFAFFILTIYMILQSLNEFSVYAKGLCYNLSFTKWEDLVDYQYVDRNGNKVFKLKVNKKILSFPKKEKTILLTFDEKQGESLAMILKNATRN